VVKRKSQTLRKNGNNAKCQVLGMAQCQKSGSRAEKILSKKRFLKTIDVAFTQKIENGEKSYMSMLGSTLLLVSLKILYCKLLSFAVTVDVTDILQTSKHNFQFRAKHQKYLKPCQKEEKHLSNDKKGFLLFAIIDFDVCLISA